MASGLAALLGNTVIGWLSDWAVELDRPWLPWLVLTVIGLGSATGVIVMHRRDRLDIAGPEPIRNRVRPPPLTRPADRGDDRAL